VHAAPAASSLTAGAVVDLAPRDGDTHCGPAPLVVHAAQDDPRSRSHRAGLSPGCERAWAGLRCRPPGQTACTGSRSPPTTSATPH